MVRLDAPADLPTESFFNTFQLPLDSSTSFLDLASKTTALYAFHQSSATAMQSPSGPLFPSPSELNPVLGSSPRNAEAGPPPLSGQAKSIHGIEMESYAIRDDVRKKRQADTQTQETYDRYVAAYEKWWNADQFARIQQDPGYVTVPAFPILVSKVVLFLNYESTRGKYKRGSSGEMIPGTNVGKEVIKSAITSLEHYRKHHEHTDLSWSVPGSEINLRTDLRIREFERAVKHNEPNRVKNSQTLKASGGSADTYTPAELTSISMYCLKNPTTKKNLLLHIRDRAMILLAASSAYRGDSLRPIEWSDLGVKDIPNNAAGLGSKLQALIMLSYNSKHNQEGRLDEHGVIRHRLVELCPIGGLAIHFFAQFHIAAMERPSFEPEFSPESREAGYGTFGRRIWYEYKVFSASDVTKSMSYDNHFSRVKTLHKANNVEVSKATHATRVYAADISRSHGSSVADTKALGGWNDQGSFKPCYDHNLPLPALLGAAMFNGAKPESHFQVRGCLRPPADVMATLFPWVEDELDALKNRSKTCSEAKDFSLEHFLSLLIYLREVLVQDLAILFNQAPESHIFSYAPFNSTSFHSFARDAPSQISDAEETSRVAFHNLPEHIAQSLRGVVETSALARQQEIIQINSQFAALSEEIAKIGGTFGLLAEEGRPRKCARKDATSGVSQCNPLPPPVPPVMMPCAITSHPLVPPPSFASTSSPVSSLPHFTINITNSPGASVTTSQTDSQKNPTDEGPTSEQQNNEDMSSSQIPLASLENSAHSAPLSAGPLPLDLRTVKWNALFLRFQTEKIMKHQWVFKDDTWIPCYEFQTLRTFADVWTEWADGLNGYLPVRVLQEQFSKPAWHQSNKAVMTEAGRRRKVITLIETLGSKPQWNILLAIEFLTTTYGQRYTPGTFARYLAKDNGKNINLVIASAAMYRR